MHPIGCIRHSTDNGALRVEVSVRCLVDQIISQAKIPVKESRYRVEGDVLIIEVVPDIESILSTVLGR